MVDTTIDAAKDAEIKAAKDGTLDTTKASQHPMDKILSEKFDGDAKDMLHSMWNDLVRMKRNMFGPEE